MKARLLDSAPPPPQNAMSAPRITRLDLAIFLVSFAVLLSELLLTRIFSVTMFYHLSFMVVSLAMLGFGASGLLVTLLPRRFPEEKLPGQAALSALLFGITSVVAVGICFQLRISLETSFANWARIGLTYVVCAVPFFFGGMTVSLILTHNARAANRLYFFDLVGAAAGCVALVPATNSLGAPSAILLAAGIAAAGAAVLARGRWALRSRLAGTLAALLIVVAFVNSRLQIYDVRFVKGVAQEPTLALAWNSFSRVEVRGDPEQMWTPHQASFPGFSSRLDPEYVVPEVGLVYDADASTQITWFDGNLARLGHLAFDVSSAAYHLRRYGRVLVIGPGGGRDILTALSMGSGPVTGVEINPITVELMRSRFRTYSGGLYTGYPGVTVVNDEGRSFLRHGNERYDLIEASLVDTWAASAAGAYALTENNLYTVEAFEDYLDHLSDDGIVCFNRWFPQLPLESLRVVNLAREALRRRGVTNPAAHVMVVRTDSNETLSSSLGSIMVKRSPFTAAEVAALRAFADDMGFVVPYAPAPAPPPEDAAFEHDFYDLLGPGGDAYVAGFSYDLTPVWDDRPFFFSRVPVAAWIANKLGLSGSPRGGAPLDLGGQTLLISLVATGLATALLLFLPWVAGRRAARRTRGGPGADRGDATPLATGRGWLWALYFLGLGLGFILIEIVLIQRFSLFLGYPVYSLSVVLFTMLLATGIGSLASGRLTARGLPRALGTLALALVAYAAFLPPLLASARGAGIAVRIAIAVATIAPLGLLMGVPFATGVRQAGGEAKGLVPWAWAVNGGASVFGSTLTVLVSMTFGFTASFVAGAVCYALSFLAAAVLSRRPAPSSAPTMAAAQAIP